MAAKRTNRLLDFLRQLTGTVEAPQVRTTLETGGQQSISNAERDTIIRRIMESTQPPSRRTGFNAYGNYIAPIARRIAQHKLDNHTIETLAPEVKTAQAIVIPSIISPTDLRDGDIALQSTSTVVDQATNDRISKVLDTHFNHHLQISRKLPDWIHEALYGAGSKPLLVLPITELDIIMNDPDAILGKGTISSGLEHLQILKQLDALETTSIFGIADVAWPKTNGVTTISKLDVNTLRPAMESVINTYVADGEPIDPKVPYNLGEQLKKVNGNGDLQWFIDAAVENLGIVDNPDILKTDRVRKGNKQAELKRRIITYYKQKTLITVNPEVKASVGDPVVYELPPESVIPIFTPGSPTDHIGYFIAIDEFGNPIHLTGDGPAIDLLDNRRVNPTTLYRSFGLDASFQFHGGHHKNEQAALMVNIYQTIIEAHLKGRLKNSGIDNIYIGATENVYRCMFARYLSLRKTRLLFVPRDLMTYFCFQHNADGTGRSKIEDVKFILSLKITLLICRMMASMNAAINRKKINITFNEQMGDPIQYMEMLKKEAIDKAVVNFTYDPAEITRTLAQRSLTIAAKGMPGAENFEVTQEANEQRGIRPDDSLIDDLNNMMVLGLDVPPSAMNLLNENEFSRSVATNNLFFSRRISAYQKIVCEKVARHVQIYTQMSESVKALIVAILKAGDEETDASKPSPEAGTSEDDPKPLSIDDKLSDVIKCIVAVLPAPDVAPNKTEFEELDALIASLTTALEGIFDNDLGDQSDNPIILVRALVKSDIIREYIRKIGVAKGVDVPTFDAAFLQRAIAFKQKITNLTKGLKDVTQKTTPPTDIPPPDDNTATGGAGF